MPGFETHWFDASNKKRLFWILQSLGWGMVAGVACAVLGNDAPPLLPLILFRGFLGLVLTSFVLRPLFRRLWKGSYPKRWWQWAGCPALAILLSAAEMKVLSLVVLHLWREEDQLAAMLLFVNPAGPIRFVAYGSWIFLYFMLNHLIGSNTARLRLERLRAEMVESELRLLRAQVNPHFLFNALNSIIAESRKPERVTEITYSLAAYLRFSLSQDISMQPLGRELDALESYLQVEKIRFEKHLEYTILADEEVRRMKVPGALVQPLVENAIKFGQLTSQRPLRITIHAQSGPEELVVKVMNSGKWVPEGTSGSTGIGLTNLRRRLHLLCGDCARLTHDARDERVVFQVQLPATNSPSNLEPPPQPA